MRKVIKNVVAIAIAMILLFGSWGITELIYKIIGI